MKFFHSICIFFNWLWNFIEGNNIIEFELIRLISFPDLGHFLINGKSILKCKDSHNIDLKM